NPYNGNNDENDIDSRKSSVTILCRQTLTITPTSTNQSVFNNFGFNHTKGAPKASNF
ncbi:283_t:CDS:2, partial [Rhizophagus irregularis]